MDKTAARSLARSLGKASLIGALLGGAAIPGVLIGFHSLGMRLTQRDSAAFWTMEAISNRALIALLPGWLPTLLVDSLIRNAILWAMVAVILVSCWRLVRPVFWVVVALIVIFWGLVAFIP
jgi:hypothetical protein